MTDEHYKHLGIRAMRRRVGLVAVEYDGPRGRIVRRFNGSAAAQRFYAEQLTAGRNPRIVGAELNGEGGGRG
jgi:hypothetical protein